MLNYRLEMVGSSLVRIHPKDERSYIALLDILSYLGYRWREGERPNSWIPKYVEYLTIDPRVKHFWYKFGKNVKLLSDQTIQRLKHLGFVSPEVSFKWYENPFFDSFILLNECQLDTISRFMKDFRSLAKHLPQVSFDENSIDKYLETKEEILT